MTNEDIVREACEATCDSIMMAIRDQHGVCSSLWKNKKMKKIVDIVMELRQEVDHLKLQLAELKILHHETLNQKDQGHDLPRE